MQFKITVDATPEEMRAFFGLPNVAPLQQGEDGFDPLSLMRPYLAPDMSSLEAMQKAFWQNFSGDSDAKASKK